MRGHVSQKRATGGFGQKRSEREAAPAENEEAVNGFVEEVCFLF